MDDLRWILAAFGVVLIAAIYFSGRFEREEWRRDREGPSGFPMPGIKPEKAQRPASRKKEEPQIGKTAEREERVRTSNSQVKADQAPEVKPANKQPMGINDEEDVIKAFDMPEPKVEELVEEAEEVKAEVKEVEKTGDVKEEQQLAKEDWKSVIESTREPLIEDEIVDVDIQDDISELATKSQKETDLKHKTEIKKPVQQELLLEIEPLVLVLTVMAKGDNYFEGKLIKRVLEGSGLRCDDNGIFQFHMTGKKDSVFSVVSTIEPGIFNPATINEYETPGLSFFCQLPGPLPNKDMFRVMQMKALNVSEKLGGQLCDDKRNLLTEQSTAHYNDRITEFDREMVLAKKKQG